MLGPSRATLERDPTAARERRHWPKQPNVPVERQAAESCSSSARLRFNFAAQEASEAAAAEGLNEAPTARGAGGQRRSSAALHVF